MAGKPGSKSPRGPVPTDKVRQLRRRLYVAAKRSPGRRFHALFDRIHRSDVLWEAWRRVRRNKGSAGVDAQTLAEVESYGVDRFVEEIGAELRAGRYRPRAVLRRYIPKADGKKRPLGIPTVGDRVVQMAATLVLEPIFEADFLPCSYGFRPMRRAHDAVAEVRHFTSRTYEWVVEGDIKACFDEISHPALLGRVRARVGDKRVLALVKAFLKAGILGEDHVLRETGAGTPQGSILSPLLSNVALSVLDEYVAQAPGGPGASRNDRLTRRRHGLPNYRLSRYADDWCLVVSGTKADAEALREEIAGVLSTMGLRLSPEKTLITHIDEGLDFLGWHIQRRRKRGTSRRYVYTYPSRKAVKAVTGKVKTRCRQNLNLPLATLLRQLNPVLRGWTAYFRPGVSSIAFGYLRAFTWRQVVRWLRRKHRGITWKELRRRFCINGWWPADGDVIMFNPGAVRTTRYRYRGTKIPSPWPSAA
ncbi:MAG TPA: group II intron reverse transcriptase/maturase [Streptosporangiaceae bacterium]